MATRKETDLERYFDEIAVSSGYGPISKTLLLRDYLGEGYAPELQSEAAITAEMFPKMVADCQRAFKRASGMPFHFYMDKARPSRIKYSGPIPDISLTHSDKVEALATIFDVGERFLTHEELFCVCKIDLYKLNHRCELADLADELGKTHETAKQMYNKAKRKLIAALKQEAPGLASHVFFTQKMSTQQRKGNTSSGMGATKFQFSSTSDDFNDPFVAKLFAISHTLFARDQHRLFCYAYLVNAGKNRANLTDQERRNAVKYASKVRKAAALESDNERLNTYLDHEDSTQLRMPEHLDIITESKMHLHIPFVAFFYMILLDNARQGQAAAFSLSRLYNAHNKVDRDTVKKLIGPAASSYVDHMKALLKEVCEEKNSIYAAHPFLKGGRRLTDDSDEKAAKAISDGVFDSDYAWMRPSDKYIADIASTLFTAREYYIIFSADFSENWNKLREIEEAIGTKSAGTTLMRCRDDLLEALAYEEPSLIEKSRFLWKMRQMDKTPPPLPILDISANIA